MNFSEFTVLELNVKENEDLDITVYCIVTLMVKYMYCVPGYVKLGILAL